MQKYSIRPHIESNKGSTLAMMVLVIGILVILGTALLSATFVGFTAKMEENRKMNALYLTEAGLDEAYAYLGEEAENACVYSRSVYVATELKNHPEYATETNDQFKKHVDDLFKEGYKYYFTNSPTTGGASGFLDRLKTKLVSNELTPDIKSTKIYSREASILTPFSSTSDKMVIQFTSDIARQTTSGDVSSRHEIITANLEINVPSYEMAYFKQQKVDNIQRNALFDKAIAVDGDFAVTGGPVTVDGNLYAHGKGDINGLIDPYTIGGVIIGGESPAKAVQSGSLTVTGNLDSANYTRIAYSTNGTPSNLNVMGNIASHSLAIQGDFKSAGATLQNAGATINVAGDASILNDTILDAKSSNITIQGSYFGFATGLLSTTLHDQSSSVIINTDDIDTDSSLSILGNPTADKATVKVFPGGSTLNKGVYIAGTIHIEQGKTYTLVDDAKYGTVTLLPEGRYKYTPKDGNNLKVADQFKVHVVGYSPADVQDLIEAVPERSSIAAVDGYLGKSYQTGDSLSVIGNYLAYSRTLNQLPDFYATTADNDNFDKLPSNKFEEFTPNTLVMYKNKAALNSPSTLMTVYDKAAYAGYVNKQEPELMTLGKGNIVVNNVQYTTGTYIKGSSTAGQLMDRSSDINSSLVTGLENLASEYNYKTNALSDPQMPDYITLSSSMKVALNVGNWLKPIWNDSAAYSVDQNDVDKKQLTYAKSSGAEGSGDALILLGSDYDKEVLADLKTQLGGQPFVERDCSSGTVSDPTKALIMSHGNIYCLGKLNYNGLLLTDKSVYCLDSNAKTFTNVNTSQTGNFVVDKAFEGLIDKPLVNTQIGFWFRQDSGWTLNPIARLIDTSQLYTGTNELGYPAALDTTIRVTNWSRKRY